MSTPSTLDQTMPALFGAARDTDSGTTLLAQLGAGPDGTAVLAQRGTRLIELVELAFGPDSARWAPLAARVRTLAEVNHPCIRAVLGLDGGGSPPAGSAAEWRRGSIDWAPPVLTLEGDNSPPLAELVEQPAVDLGRVVKLMVELARAIGAAHRVGIVHGRLHPWSVHIGANDRPRIELSGIDTAPIHEDWAAACVPPERRDLDLRVPADAAGDVFALGALLQLFARSARRSASAELSALIADATAADPDARPTMVELVRRLMTAASALDARPTLDDTGDRPPRRAAAGTRLGRFELTSQLGVGAMGEVWEAVDTSGGEPVAIKLLKPEIAADAEQLRRFRKEGRVLARVGSPYIANAIDLNEDGGVHYLVLELVSGGSVAAALRRQTRFPESLALAIVADTCRALAEPHRLGIVHRDIKPDNVMFVRAGIETELAPTGQLIKLGDFGIARIVEATAPGTPDGATRDGTVLGTPEYMAPEQCQGAQVTPATDVYALGVCLFAMIAGHAPFRDDTPMGVILQQLNEPPPTLASVVPDVTPAVAELVARCLAKDPRARFADATELLAAIDGHCNGAIALITAHPAPPVFRERAVQTYAFEWELAASPEALWPFVSNTEKMNRAAGLAPVRFELAQIGGGDPQTTGNQRVGGVALRWKEHPYEWIEGSRHVVLRVFDAGLLRWYVAEVALERLPGGGTRLRNTVRLEARGWIARLLSKWEMGVRYKRRLDRVYRRLDRVIAAGPRPDVDPIDPEIVVSASARAAVQALGEKLGAAGVAPGATDALTSYLLHAGDQDLARIRPLELAARFRVPDDDLVDACLHATAAGALDMVWDVICPSCKIPSNVVDSLAKIEEHGHCKACNLGYEVDFSRAIELAFRASPQIREVETRTFCIGGPAHFPHVAAQVRLAPGERFALPMVLSAGLYLVRSPQLARSHDLRVTAHGGVRRLDLVLGEPGELAPLTAGDQLLTLTNPSAREVVVRVERAGDRELALTAARAMACASFRELFPDQALAPGRLLAVTQATLVVAQLDAAATLFRELGDSKAYPVASRFFEQVAVIARELGGTLIKTFGGMAICGFERPGPAVDAALALQAVVDRDPLTTGLECRIAVHRGPMMVMTQGGRLDYFGQHVERALAVVAATPPAMIGLTAAVCQDIGVAERIQTSTGPSGLQVFGDTWVRHVRSARGNAPA